MKVEIRLFGLMTVFFAVAGVVYYVWSREWAGTVLLVLSSGLAGMTGGYLFLQARLERRPGRREAAADGEAGGEDEYLPALEPVAARARLRVNHRAGRPRARPPGVAGAGSPSAPTRAVRLALPVPPPRLNPRVPLTDSFTKR